MDRVVKGSKQGLLLSVICSTTITLLILLFGRYLMGIFSETESLVSMSYYLMKILAAGYIAVAVSQSLSGVMRGAGDTMTPMWISLITTVALRIPIAYGISFLTRSPSLPHGRFECVHVSLLISWTVGALLTVLFYAFGRWKKKRIRS